MKRTEELMWLIGILLAVAALFLGVPMITSDVIGANASNSTSVAKVFVWNTEPNITQVYITPDPIDLTPGNTTTVNCTAFVFDYNGWEDVTNVSGTFYDLTEGDGDTADNNYRYINSSCQPCTAGGSSVTNATCTCQFFVWYYANAGDWACNITVHDYGGNATERFFYFNDSQNSSSVRINHLIGIDSPDEIDYGNLSVTETSELIQANISNWGNVGINVSVRGFAGSDETIPEVGNLSMLCDFGNISINNQRYAINNATVFQDMTNLTNTTTVIPDFQLPVRTNETGSGNATNATFWKLYVPLSVGGSCNGTIQFFATQADVI